MRFPAPSRVWFQTGSGLWASREWEPGEKARYHDEVGYEQPVDNSKEAVATLCEMWGTK